MRWALIRAWAIGILVAGLGVPSGLAASARDDIVIAQGADLTNGDPYRTTATYDFNVLANVYETLIGRDAALHLRPGLAVSWKQVRRPFGSSSSGPTSAFRMGSR